MNKCFFVQLDFFMPKLISSEEAVLIEPDSGKRIQAGTKGNTCWYTAENYIRRRFHALQQEEGAGRAIEKQHSTIRKEITHLEQITSNVVKRQLIAIIQKYRNFAEAIERVNELITSEDNSITEIKKNHPWFLDAVLITLKQLELNNKNDLIYSPRIEVEQGLSDYLEKARFNGMIDIYLRALTLSGQDVEDLKKNHCFRICPREYLETLYHKIRRKEYGLYYSDWSPAAGFDALLTILRNSEKGLNIYLDLSGLAGAIEYTHVGDVDGRSILEINENVPEISRSSHIMHQVVVVGAERKQSNLKIIYHDPNNTSTEEKPAPFLSISYDFFCNHLREIATDKREVLVKYYLLQGPTLFQKTGHETAITNNVRMGTALSAKKS